MRNLPFGDQMFKRGPRDTQNNIGYCCCSWLPPRSWSWVLLLKSPATWLRWLLDLTWKLPPRGLALMVPEVSIQDAKKGRDQLSYPALLLSIYNHDGHSKISLKVQWWCSYFSSRKQQSNWIWGLLNKKEIMSSIRNLVKDTELIRPWTLEESLLLPLY